MLRRTNLSGSLDRMTTSQDEATIAYRIQRDPGQPRLERIHQA